MKVESVACVKHFYPFSAFTAIGAGNEMLSSQSGQLLSFEYIQRYDHRLPYTHSLMHPESVDIGHRCVLIQTMSTSVGVVCRNLVSTMLHSAKWQQTVLFTFYI